MSLIQDALKRQQEESESNRLSPEGAPPSVPVTMPASPRPELAAAGSPAISPLSAAMPVGPDKPVQTGKTWKQIVGIIIFCILIVWGGALLARLALKQSPGRAWLGKFMPGLASARVTAGKPEIKAPPPPAAAISEPVVAPAPTPIPWISTAAAAAPAFLGEGEEDEDAVLHAVNTRDLPVIAPSPVPVAWPRLKLSAIFRNVGSGQAGARLNNRLILLGNQIDGVTLVEIRQDSVVLKYGVETRLLKMGMTLNGI